MASKMTWHGDVFRAEVKAEMGRRLNVAAVLVSNRAKQLISTDGTGVGDNGNLIYGANPSTPGSPPNVQHGRLRGSVAWEIVNGVARVGTNVKYGRWLELGTAKMAARPWLRRALLEMKSKIQAALTHKIS